jgi:hypothetical protein
MEGTTQYLGVKFVAAKPMKLGPYNDFRGWAMPADEDPETEGYLVIYPDGYKSWCPKAQFEEANRPICSLTFGHAIEAAKAGKRIARAGWNDKNMFVVYQPGYPEGIPCNANTAAAFGYDLGENFKCRPYLQMRCADGMHQMWLASQSDILEEDWMIV